MRAAAKTLIILESGGAMVARLFDAQRCHLAEFDAASEEVTVMTRGLPAREGVDAADWGLALHGHAPAELAGARLFELDV